MARATTVELHCTCDIMSVTIWEMGMTGCWGPTQLTVPHVSHSVLYPTQLYSCYFNCSRPRWIGKTVQLKSRDLASVGLPSLTRSLPQKFFMTAGSGATPLPQLHQKSHWGLETSMWFGFTVLTGISDPKLKITRAIMET